MRIGAGGTDWGMALKTSGYHETCSLIRLVGLGVRLVCMSRRFEGFQWRFSAYPSHPIALFKGCNFEFFGPAKPGVVLVSNYLGRFWVTRDCTYGLTDHVWIKKV